MTQLTPLLRIGTRGSPLALAQAETVRARLAAAHGVAADAIAITVIRTSGDAIQDRPLADVGGKGLFTKEIDLALSTGSIDLAVHSAKDMPTGLPSGLRLAACLPREDARDVLVSRLATSLAALPPGARVGTGSLRRQALIKQARPDVSIVPLRGNVETRLRKTAEGVADATILALAGLKRLGLDKAAAAILALEEFPPAVGQGVIAIESRDGDNRTHALVAAVDDPATTTALTAERAFLAILDGSCKTPIAGHARVVDDVLQFYGLIIRPDGTAAFTARRTGGIAAAAALGADAGRELRERAGADFFAAI